MGPGSDGPMSGLGGMDSHHMNGSLGNNSKYYKHCVFSVTSDILYDYFPELHGRLYKIFLKLKKLYIKYSFKVLTFFLSI